MTRALPHRRLHRLLHRHPPRHHGRQAVPPRQPAAAQLQVGADRLPRPRLVDRRQRPALQAAARARPRRRTRATPVLRPQPSGSTTSWSSACSSARATRWASRSPIDEAEDAPVRRDACSTTGRRATCRPGSTSRSGPFLSKNFATHALALDRDDGGAGAVPRAVRAARRATRSRCPTSTRRPTASTARSTSRWRSGCRPRRCARPARPPVRLSQRQRRASRLLDRRAAASRTTP